MENTKLSADENMIAFKLVHILYNNQMINAELFHKVKQNYTQMSRLPMGESSA